MAVWGGPGAKKGRFGGVRGPKKADLGPKTGFWPKMAKNFEKPWGVPGEIAKNRDFLENPIRFPYPFWPFFGFFQNPAFFGPVFGLGGPILAVFGLKWPLGGGPGAKKQLFQSPAFKEAVFWLFLGQEAISNALRTAFLVFLAPSNPI